MPDLTGGTSDIVFSTLGSGTAVTQLGGGLVDIRSLRSNVLTGFNVPLGSSAAVETGLSINSGTLVVRSGTITKANQAALVINSTLQLTSDGWFSSTNVSNSGLIIAGPIIEDATSRNVVINASAGLVAIAGVNTYTGSTTVERGTLLVGLTANAAGAAVAPGVAGALGIASSEVLVGNANTLANNWNVGLTLATNQSMSRTIRFANAGNGTATLTTTGTALLRSGTIILDRTINWNAISANNAWTGLVTGSGGIIKGGANTLQLANTANDFTGSVSLLNANLEVDLSGTLSGLGRGTSVIQIVDAGNTTARQFLVNGSGTLSRGFNVVATAANTVTVTTANATNDVTFSGDMAINSLGANVTLGAGNAGTARYTGVITGSAPVLRFSGASSNGSKLVLSNTANAFTGEIRVATAGLFVGGDAPAGAPGALGNATSSIVVGDQASGVNPSYLMIDGPYTVGRNILIPGPANGGSNSFTADVGIGGGAAADAVFSGDLTITRTPGVGINYLMATSGGSVEFSGAMSGSAAIRVGGGSGTRTGFGSAHARLGDVILSGNNAGFSGDVTVQTGVRLVLASDTALGTGTTAVNVGDINPINSGTGGISTRGAVTVTRNFVSNRTITNNNRPISFEGTTADPSVFTGNISVTGTNSAQPITFAAVAGGSVDFQGAISATSSFAITTNITKAGAGLVSFSGSNSYNGTTFVNAGVLSIGSTNSLPGWNVSRRLNVASGAAFVVGDAVSEADFSTILASGTFAANAAIGFNVGPGGRLPLSTPIANPVAANPLGFVKIGSGTLTMNAANSYTGTTTVSAGVLRLANGLALQNSTLDTTGAGRIELAVTAPTLGGLSGATDLATEFSDGFGSMTGLTLNLGSGVTQTYNGVVSDGAAGMTLTKAGQGTQILSGANSHTGQTTVSAGVLQLGVGSSLPGNIANAGGLVLFQGGPSPGVVSGVISGTGRVAVGGGTVVLSNAASSFTGPTVIDGGCAEVALLSNGGLNSPLGTSGTISLGSGTSLGTLRYVGSGHSTDRLISLAGTSGGGGVLDASGSGTVAFTGGVTGAADTTLTLTGSNAGGNFIQGINSPSLGVVKNGVGTWVLGSNSFSGRLTIEQGTVIAAAITTSTFSPLGDPTSPMNPLIGLADATGTAAILVANGFTISRTIEVAAPGTGSQEVILGGSGAGTSTFDGTFKLGRGVTLAADPGGTVRFAVPADRWQELNSTANPAVAITVGTPTATGTVALLNPLPGSITAVNVRQGTLRLAVSSSFAATTPVTVGSGFGPATLDLANLSQSLQTLSFGGTAGLVVPGGSGGTLRLGGASPLVTATAGTGHRIDAGIALNEAATFTVSNVAAQVTVAGGIANGTNGARGFTKNGAGTLTLTGNSTYTGATAVDAGTLRVDGLLGNTALTVAVGATLTGTGTIGGFTTIQGTHSPGASPGIETFTNGLSYVGTSTLVWELIANTESQRGILFDGVDLTGGALSIVSGATLSLVFNLPGSTVNWDDSFWDSERSWTIIDVAGGSWNSSLFTTLLVGVDSGTASLASKRPDSSFRIVAADGDLVLQYVIVPEPGTLALAGLGLAAAAWAARRRQLR